MVSSLKDCKILVELIVKTINHVMQPVVDAFDPRLLVSPPTFHNLDFTRMKVIFYSNYNLLRCVLQFLFNALFGFC